MTAFGRGALLRAQAKTRTAGLEVLVEQKLAEQAERKTRLARTLFRVTVESMGPHQDHMTLEPSPKQSDRQRFLSVMGLTSEFEIDRLSLLARGDRSLGSMQYDLNYRQASSGQDIQEVISSFTAEDHPLATEVEPLSETLLSRGGQEILFVSDDYKFVRSIAGLFLPQVTSELQKEGL